MPFLFLSVICVVNSKHECGSATYYMLPWNEWEYSACEYVAFSHNILVKMFNNWGQLSWTAEIIFSHWPTNWHRDIWHQRALGESGHMTWQQKNHSHSVWNILKAAELIIILRINKDSEAVLVSLWFYHYPPHFKELQMRHVILAWVTYQNHLPLSLRSVRGVCSAHPAGQWCGSVPSPQASLTPPPFSPHGGSWAQTSFCGAPGEAWAATRVSEVESHSCKQ